jgi:hypothetical protein
MQARRLMAGAATVAVVALLTPGKSGAECNGPVTLKQIKSLGQKEDPGAAPPYTIKDGKVDIQTHKGWIRFSGFCERCHGPSGEGSEIAPSLASVTKTFNKFQFEIVMKCGLKGDLGDGIMPGWANDPNVEPYIDNLWAYLKARSEGGLPPGRPGLLKISGATPSAGEN